PSGMNIIGRYAQNHQIYFVSPLAPRVGVENNTYQIVATAPVEMHTSRAAEFIGARLRPSSVVVVSTADDDESKYISSFMKQMQAQAPSVPVKEVDVGSYGSNIAVLKEHLQAGRQNVLVVPSQRPTFWKILFAYLDMLPDSYRYTILAHPGFAGAENIDMVKAEKYNVYVTSSGSAAHRQQAGSGFYRSYRQKYGVPPSEYAAKGFDVAMYFGSALWNGRKNIAGELGKHYSGYQNEFEFVQTPSGFINKGVKILKVQDYEFVEQR
ncbi:MAG TPA: hypothetical protein VD772_05135, partial [Anseongella sp.]|nr:hypothetical protein [Anseongella sp.]